MPARLTPITTINMSARLASSSWITMSPTRQGVVFGGWIMATPRRVGGFSA